MEELKSLVSYNEADGHVVFDKEVYQIERDEKKLPRTFVLTADFILLFEVDYQTEKGKLANEYQLKDIETIVKSKTSNEILFKSSNGELRIQGLNEEEF